MKLQYMHSWCLVRPRAANGAAIGCNDGVPPPEAGEARGGGGDRQPRQPAHGCTSLLLPDGTVWDATRWSITARQPISLNHYQSTSRRHCELKAANTRFRGNPERFGRPELCRAIGGMLSFVYDPVLVPYVEATRVRQKEIFA